MTRNRFLLFTVVIVLGMFGIGSAQAGEPKVDVCHVPPGNPTNFHTIRIGPDALSDHLAHGDLEGACDALCAQLCNDGDACTIDDTGQCESQGCPIGRDAVDCSDGNLCTADMCDAVNGCSNPTAVWCNAPDLCTSSTCDPLTGQCAETPLVCPESEPCDLANGLCGGGGECGTPPPGDDCPCDFSQATLDALFAGPYVFNQPRCMNYPGRGHVLYADFSLAVVEFSHLINTPTSLVHPSCGLMETFDGSSLSPYFCNLTPEQAASCLADLVAYEPCPCPQNSFCPWQP